MIIQGRIQEFLMGGGGAVQTLVQKGLFKFLGKIASPPPPPPTHTHPIPPVEVALYNSLAPYRVLLCERRRTDHKRLPKNNYIF